MIIWTWYFSTNLMSTSLAISTSSPSMFQGEVTPCGWMMGDVLEFLSSSLSSSSSPDQHITDWGRIFTADTACVSTKERLNCRGRQKPTERGAPWRGLVCNVLFSLAKLLLLFFNVDFTVPLPFSCDCCLGCSSLRDQQRAVKARRRTEGVT